MALRPETEQALRAALAEWTDETFNYDNWVNWEDAQFAQTALEKITPVLEDAIDKQNMRMMKATMEALIMGADSMKRIYVAGVATAGGAVEQRVAHQQGEGMQMVIDVMKATLSQHLDRMQEKGILEGESDAAPTGG